MGRTPVTLQVPIAVWEAQDRRDCAEADDTATAAQVTDEYVVSLLRVLARKEPGELWSAREREACRNVLRAIKRHWR